MSPKAEVLKGKFIAGAKEIHAEAERKLEQLRQKIGDQDQDGDVDLHDVVIRVEQKTGPIRSRELAFVGAGMVIAFVMIKVIPFVMKAVGL